MAEYATIEQACGYCGAQYRPRKYRANPYCSRACANKARRIRTSRTCSACGYKFMPPRNHGGQKFCSCECRDDARRTRRAVPCLVCGKLVIRTAGRANRNVYCSHSCQGRWKSIYVVGRTHSQWKSRICRSCNTCGVAVERLPSQFKQLTFCSKLCEGIWRSRHLSGEQSPTWSGGYEPYYGPDWRSQRRKAHSREGCCRRCGSLTRLQVHHIRPFREHEHHMEANRLGNLMILCRVCHPIVEWEQRRASI